MGLLRLWASFRRCSIRAPRASARGVVLATGLTLGTLAAVVAGGAATEGVAFAGPDAGKLRNAADAFEEGARAFKDGRFEEAAAHFESADSNVPSAKALRWAMRARSEAKQGSRAATLAALALDRHKDDAETAKLATETLDRFALGLHKLKVECVSPCLLAESGRIVHGEAATRRTLFLEPGSVALSATFVGNITAPEQTVQATPGGSGEVRFAPKKDTPAAALPPTSDTASPVTPPPGKVVAPPTTKEERFGANPALFVFGLTSTVTSGGMLLWSAVDSTSLPSLSEVRRACRGKSEEECGPLQSGNRVETRTNVLIGTTAALGGLTILAAILTDWGGGGDSETDKATAAKEGVQVKPTVLWVDALDGKGQGAGASVGGTPVFGAAGVF